ncbi:hypothetical protein HCN44_006932 [Aphidius gifuensis]|uniref:Uncharacterized protein n=1 Tax=Aphidius gifuensis TaxID=684658 RepID=A0A835CWT9_APHGI|nr:uncharacterized protein PFB0145c-like isoform X1 [Aphidius gifuensis]KAF7995825.1 hypothetical protein HCN44_006932 [Aphidius gifuensis]
MSEEINFDCEIDIKEEMDCLKSICSYFLDNNNDNKVDNKNCNNKIKSYPEKMNENSEFCNCPLSNLDEQLQASIIQAERSISQISLHSNVPLQVSKNNLSINKITELPLEKNMSSKEIDFFDDEPPTKRSKYNDFTNIKIFIDEGTQTQAPASPDKIKKKMINQETQTVDQKTQNDADKIMISSETQTDDKLLDITKKNKPKNDNSLLIIEEIKTIIDNRKKRLSSLSSSITKASNYLDELKKALDPSMSSTSPTALLQLPKNSGYDSQFDFPIKNRYCKLPVIVENSSGIHQSKLKKTLVINKTKKVEICLPSKQNKKSLKRRVLMTLNKENICYR